MRDPAAADGVDTNARGRLDAALGGDRRAADAVTLALRAEDPDHELLDVVARQAAAGSLVALDLLLGAVDEMAITRAPIRRLLVDDDAVDDVAQDVLIAVAERIATFRGDSRFTTWLFQIARFKTIDHLRRQRDSASLDDDEAGAVSDRERLSSMIARRATIRHALDALPDHYRRAVTHRDIDQLPYAEIAEREAVPINTAKTRVARGRALLAATLAQAR